MFRGSSKKLSKGITQRIKGFLENSLFIRQYIWKYRSWISIGLLALVVVDTLEILPPIFLKSSIDIIVERKPASLLGVMALAYLVTSLIQGVCRYTWRMYLIRASIHAGRDLRGQYVRHLFGLS